MKRITRTSTAPGADLFISLNGAGGGSISAGVGFSEVVSDEVAAIFEGDAGLQTHFKIEELVEPSQGDVAEEGPARRRR